MKTAERFIKYARIHTASAENSGSIPSTSGQLDLTRELEREMREMGMSEVYSDGHGYVYATIPASPGCEECSAIGFIAHIDTVPDFNGKNVVPTVTENYDGGDVPLGTSGKILSTELFPHLPSLRGQTLITTDGTSVLGADDKAGIAAIMTACERIMENALPHGRIAICFTPDEEIGHGAALLDIQRMAVDFAFTVDGEALDEINYETFNAASAHFDIKGVNIHPGSAKNKMINAALVAMEINSMLPCADIPSKTEGHEGFYHLTEMNGSVEHAELDYIVRDHSAQSFAARVRLLAHIEKTVNEKYGENTVRLTVREQYRNMAEKLREHMDIVELAKKAVTEAGFACRTVPVRGGTDGSQLSFRGLLCPNIGTGGYACHGPYEHITAERLDSAAEIVLNIIRINTERSRSI